MTSLSPNTSGTHSAESKTLVLPGNYDGVHLGHQDLIQRAKRIADDHGLRVVVLTFDPHPATIIKNATPPDSLTSIAARTALLKHYGVDQVHVQHFDEAFSKLTPEQFSSQVLVNTLQCKYILVGEDFHFGYKRAGNVQVLEDLGKQHGYEVQVIAPVRVAKEVVSSTTIRRVLKDGEVSKAHRLLGRPYSVIGRVVLGERRGRTIGFPTANLDGVETLLPKQGVYAVYVGTKAARVYRGVCNVGPRPTVDQQRAFEVHLLDFSDDLYDQPLTVSFVERLREQQRFSNLEALKTQITQDIQRAARAFEGTQNLDWQWLHKLVS